MKKILTLIIFSAIVTACFAQDSSLTVKLTDIATNKVNVIGVLGKPLGAMVTVKGVLIDYFSKRGDGRTNLIVKMIDDSAVQNIIQIPVSFFWDIDNEQPLAKLTLGDTYMFRGFETGNYVGTPRSVIEHILSGQQEIRYDTIDGKVEVTVPGYLPQSTPYHFQNRLMVIKWEKTEPITWSPGQFVGKNALLQGIAVNENGEATINHAGWKLRLRGYRKWADKVIGKTVEVYGIVKTTAINNVYRVEVGRARLVNLEDMVDQTVTLRGRAISLNGYWWFNYRGTDIYVENMDKLPGWSVNNHFRTMELTGVLEQATLPRIDQIAVKKDRDKKLYYIVKNASWAAVDELLLPEIAYDEYGAK